MTAKFLPSLSTLIDALASLARRRRLTAVYTMPTLHNPLGTVTAAEHRLALVESDAFAVGPSAARPAVRLALSSPPSHARLAEALREVRAATHDPTAGY